MNKAVRCWIAALVFLFVTAGITDAPATEYYYVLAGEYLDNPVAFGEPYSGTYPEVSEYDAERATYFRYLVRTPEETGWLVLHNQDRTGSDRFEDLCDRAGTRLLTTRSNLDWGDLKAQPDTEYEIHPRIIGQIPNCEPEYGFTLYFQRDPDGETSDAATPFVPGETVEADIAANKDNDWFVFNTGNASAYDLDFSLLSIPSTISSLFLELTEGPDAASPICQFSPTRPTQQNFQLELRPETTYYVHIYSNITSQALCKVAPAKYSFSISAPNTPVSSITLDQTKATLTRASDNKKPTLQLTATVEPEDATDPSVEWTSSNPKVAKVDENGKVTALKKGTAVITCTAKDGSGVKAECKITVKDKLVTKLTLNKKKVTIKKGKTFQLKVKTIKPANAFNQKVTWKSSNTKIATVDKNGKVKAKKKGTCIITCTAKDGSGKKVTCKVTVK